jgi:hypothetical protein
VLVVQVLQLLSQIGTNGQIQYFYYYSNWWWWRRFRSLMVPQQYQEVLVVEEDITALTEVR